MSAVAAPDTRPLQTLLGNRPFYSPAIAISMFAPNHATFGVCFYLGGLLRELVEGTEDDREAEGEG